MNDFMKNFELSIVYRSNAYLLNELLQDWLFFCEDREVSSQVRYIWQLKKHIDDRFPDTIGFYRTGRHMIVYSQNVNPCQYSISTLKGYLRKIITEVLILYPLSENSSESSQTLEMEPPTKTAHS